jgi:ATP-dependent protease ClpP protease subunit
MYCINPQDDKPVFLLDGPIGVHTEGERSIDGDEFAREMLAAYAQGKRGMSVWINSPGGNVAKGMAIYHAILKTGAETKCVGIAYSIAGVIMQAGKKRVMTDFGSLMYHNAYVPEDDGESNKFLRVINEALTTMISSRSWKDAEAVKKMMKKETYITAQEALEADLCDEVENSGAVNKPGFEVHARWQFAQTVLNQTLEIKKPSTMNKAEICALLGLDPNVSDAVAMAKLKEHLAKNQQEAEAGRAVVNEKEKKDLEDKLAKAEKDAADAKAALAKTEADARAKADADAKAQAEKTAAEKKEAGKKKIVDALNARGLPHGDDDIKDYCALGLSARTMHLHR